MTVGFSFVTMSLAAAGKCKLVGLAIRLWNATVFALLLLQIVRLLLNPSGQSKSTFQGLRSDFQFIFIAVAPDS